MNRQEEALELAEALLTDVELSETSTAKRVLKAMRLARLMQDDTAQEWLRFEIEGVPNSARGREWMTRARRWTDEEATRGYWAPAAELEAILEGSRSSAAQLAGDVSLSGDYITIAMRERSQLITSHNKNATSMAKVLAAIDAQIYRYAGDVYAELRFSQVQASLFDSARASVDAALVAMGGSALRKLDSISERLTAGDDEAVSQAMNSCRRLIDAAADHLFPAQDDH